jgi:uncharacterized protein YbbK (DUF523 family)
MKAMWIAPNGRKYMIEAKTLDEVNEAISELRESLGFPKPDAVLVQSDDPKVQRQGNMNVEDLPQDVQDQMLKQAEVTLDKAAKKHLN